MQYIGRFAPSPTGPLHTGSLVTAMASYLDAKAHHGEWLLRIEDVDETRTVPGAAEAIIKLLTQFGMHWDREIIWQSNRKALYQAAYERLAEFTYACGCTRREIVDSRIGIAADGAVIYPGTCRHGLPAGRIGRTLRVRVPEQTDSGNVISFDDRREGLVTLNLATEAGDFVLRRADGFWAYQIAVVVDDAEQSVTHVVRGTDLLYSSPRQIYLQRLLKLPTPKYLHLPVVKNEFGEKLSKQNGAVAIEIATQDNKPVTAALVAAARFLGMPIHKAESIEDFWRRAVPVWQNLLDDRAMR